MEYEYVNPAAEELQSEASEKWLTFFLDGQLYGASIFHTEQIINMQPVTTVPEYPACAKGIIDLRGMIVPVIDLRLRFGKKEAEYTDKTCIITCRVDEQLIGFIVDEVDAVLDVAPENLSPPPWVSGDPAARYLTAIARIPAEGGTRDKIVLCLDVTKVLRSEELDELKREKR